MFSIDRLYSREDIYNILDVPKNKRGGAWLTGYIQYKGEFYLFVNIGTSGRTGHNYNNHWEGDLLYWKAKNRSTVIHQSIKNMTDRIHKVHIFTRTDSGNIYFTYQGIGIAERVEATEPVTVYWRIDNEFENSYLYDEITINEKYTEGSVKKIIVNSYERNEKARKDCIKYYGCKCIICGTDFGEIYSEIGEGFIHVHHLRQLSDINNEYIIDPIKDLRPVCPNCHAMIHKRKVPYSIEEISKIINKNKL